MGSLWSPLRRPRYGRLFSRYSSTFASIHVSRHHIITGDRRAILLPCRHSRSASTLARVISRFYGRCRRCAAIEADARGEMTMSTPDASFIYGFLRVRVRAAAARAMKRKMILRRQQAFR